MTTHPSPWPVRVAGVRGHIPLGAQLHPPLGHGVAGVRELVAMNRSRTRGRPRHLSAAWLARRRPVPVADRVRIPGVEAAGRPEQPAGPARGTSSAMSRTIGTSFWGLTPSDWLWRGSRARRRPRSPALEPDLAWPLSARRHHHGDTGLTPSSTRLALIWRQTPRSRVVSELRDRASPTRGPRQRRHKLLGCGQACHIFSGLPPHRSLSTEPSSIPSARLKPPLSRSIRRRTTSRCSDCTT